MHRAAVSPLEMGLSCLLHPWALIRSLFLFSLSGPRGVWDPTPGLVHRTKPASQTPSVLSLSPWCGAWGRMGLGAWQWALRFSPQGTSTFLCQLTSRSLWLSGVVVRCQDSHGLRQLVLMGRTKMWVSPLKRAQAPLEWLLFQGKNPKASALPMNC